jgi:hypothetical protein
MCVDFAEIRLLFLIGVIVWREVRSNASSSISVSCPAGRRGGLQQSRQELRSLALLLLSIRCDLELLSGGSKPHKGEEGEEEQAEPQDTSKI